MGGLIALLTAMVIMFGAGVIAGWFIRSWTEDNEWGE